MNTIVIEFSPEDRKRLDELTSAVLLLATTVGSSLSDPVRQQVVDATVAPTLATLSEKTQPAPAEHPADVPTTHLEPPAPAADPIPAPALVSLGEFQKALVTRCAESAAVKLKVQALVHQYAESVSAIPEDKRPEVLAALAQI